MRAAGGMIRTGGGSQNIVELATMKSNYLISWLLDDVSQKQSVTNGLFLFFYVPIPSFFKTTNGVFITIIASKNKLQFSI